MTRVALSLLDARGLVSSADEWNKGSCEVMISVDVVVVIVAPALAALTEVEGDVVAAPFEVFVANGFVAALTFFISINADAVATPIKPSLASVHALGLMGKD